MWFPHCIVSHLLFSPLYQYLCFCSSQRDLSQANQVWSRISQKSLQRIKSDVFVWSMKFYVTCYPVVSRECTFPFMKTCCLSGYSFMNRDHFLPLRSWTCCLLCLKHWPPQDVCDPFQYSSSFFSDFPKLEVLLQPFWCSFSLSIISSLSHFLL